jgi:hypothetical protein
LGAVLPQNVIVSHASGVGYDGFTSFPQPRPETASKLAEIGLNPTPSGPTSTQIIRPRFGAICPSTIVPTLGDCASARWYLASSQPEWRSISSTIRSCIHIQVPLYTYIWSVPVQGQQQHEATSKSSCMRISHSQQPVVFLAKNTVARGMLVIRSEGASPVSTVHPLQSKKPSTPLGAWSTTKKPGGARGWHDSTPGGRVARVQLFPGERAGVQRADSAHPGTRWLRGMCLACLQRPPPRRHCRCPAR